MFENKLDFFSRKTVVILDRSAKFLAPSKQHIDFDSGGKRGAGKKASSALVYKSLWTCCVEGAVEYSRIVYDLFPCRYMVSMSGVKWRGTCTCTCIGFNCDHAWDILKVVLAPRELCASHLKAGEYEMIIPSFPLLCPRWGGWRGSND